MWGGSKIATFKDSPKTNLPRKSTSDKTNWIAFMEMRKLVQKFSEWSVSKTGRRGVFEKRQAEVAEEAGVNLVGGYEKHMP